MAAQGIKISAIPLGNVSPDILLRPTEYNQNVAQGLRDFDPRIVMQTQPLESAFQGAGNAMQALRQRQNLQEADQSMEQRDKLFPEQLAQEQAQTEAAQYARDLQEAGKAAAMEEAALSPEEKARRGANIEVEKQKALIEAKQKAELEQMQKAQDYQMQELDSQFANQQKLLESKNASDQEKLALQNEYNVQRDKIKAMYSPARVLSGKGSIFGFGQMTKEQELQYKEDLKLKSKISQEEYKHGLKRDDQLREDWETKGGLQKARDMISSANQFKIANARFNESFPDTGGFVGNLILQSNPLSKSLLTAASTSYQSMVNASTKLMLSSKPPGMGAMSDQEWEILRRAALDPKNSKELNEFIADRLALVAQSELDRNDFYNQLKSELGTAQAALELDKRWNEYTRNNPYFIKREDGELIPNPHRVSPEAFFKEDSRTEQDVRNLQLNEIKMAIDQNPNSKNAELLKARYAELTKSGQPQEKIVNQESIANEFIKK